MAKLVTLEQHSDRQPTTVVTQATAWWEVALALVKLQGGLGVHLLVKVFFYCLHEHCGENNNLVLSICSCKIVNTSYMYHVQMHKKPIMWEYKLRL